MRFEYNGTYRHNSSYIVLIFIATGRHQSEALYFRSIIISMKKLKCTKRIGGDATVRVKIEHRFSASSNEPRIELPVQMILGTPLIEPHAAARLSKSKNQKIMVKRKRNPARKSKTMVICLRPLLNDLFVSQHNKIIQHDW